MDVREKQLNSACDLITMAVATIINAGDETATREVVPELDRIRSFLVQRVSGRRIRLEDAARAR